MTDDVKERIRTAVELSDVVGEVVALKPAGRDRLKGLCPFHAEKTPSFHVHTGRGFYYCFGCGAKGDVFDFVMQTRSIDFFEALQVLGHRAGIDVEAARPSGKGAKRRDLVAVNELAEAWFKKQLHGEEGRVARTYLEQRGLTSESIDAWGLGFAPDGWDGLLKHALTEGVRDDDLLEVGLISENERGRRYDRFRGRIIFPIRDRLGRVVGFSGRVLGDEVPKYLNTPETALFDKGSILYGLDRARSAIRERAECLVVEGYMDVIALHQTGFPHAVAALGATLTEGQAQELTRLDVQRLLLAFDADEAGQRAVLAGLDQAVGRQFLVRAIRVPHGKDPADAVLGGHVEEFREALQQGVSEVEFRFRSVIDAIDERSPEGRREALERLAPSLVSRGLHDDVAAEMRRLVTHAFDLDERQLLAWLDGRRAKTLDDTQLRGMQRRGAAPSGAAGIEVEVMALLLSDAPRLKARLADVVAHVPSELEPSLLREFAEICEEEGYDPDAILGRYREREEGEVLFARAFDAEQAGLERRMHLERHLDTSLARLREQVLDKGASQLRASLHERIDEISALLDAQDLDEATLQAYYDELAELHAALAAREAERRVRVRRKHGPVKRR